MIGNLDPNGGTSVFLRPTIASCIHNSRYAYTAYHCLVHSDAGLKSLMRCIQQCAGSCPRGTAAAIRRILNYGTRFEVFVKCSWPLRTRAEMTLQQQQSRRPGAQPANTWMNWLWL